MLAVVVLIRESNWLAFDEAISTSSFGLFYHKVRNLRHSVLMVKDCTSVFLGGFLQPIFFQLILDLVVCSECSFRSSKPCMARMFAGGPFLCCLCSAIFKLRRAVDVRKNKMTDLVFDILLYFRGRFVWHFIYRLYKALFSLKYIRLDTL